MDTIWILENLEIYLEQLSYANLLFNCKFYENQTLIKYVQRKFSIWIDSVSVKYTLDFKELLLKNVKCLNNKCPINYMLTW